MRKVKHPERKVLRDQKKVAVFGLQGQKALRAYEEKKSTLTTKKSDEKKPLKSVGPSIMMFAEEGSPAMDAYEKAKRDSENFNDPQAKRWGREVT